MLDCADMPVEADYAGYPTYVLQEAISAEVARIRNRRTKARSDREELRSILNGLLHEYGFRVHSLPNWRGAAYS